MNCFSFFFLNLFVGCGQVGKSKSSVNQSDKLVIKFAEEHMGWEESIVIVYANFHDPPGFFLQFWEGTLGPFRLGKLTW